MDTRAEYDQLYFPRQGQGRQLRPGYTREQAERMFARRDAVIMAGKTKYSRKDVDTVKYCIDWAIEHGHTELSRDGRWGWLARIGDDGEWDSRIRFSTIVEFDYISVVLNTGKLARNY